MSVRAMTWAFEQHMRPGPKLVLLALADRANEDGQCSPTVPALAVKCSLTPRAVQLIIRHLVSAGALSVSEQFIVGTKGKNSHLYRLAMTTRTTKSGGGGEVFSPGGGEVFSPGGEVFSPGGGVGGGSALKTLKKRLNPDPDNPILKERKERTHTDAAAEEAAGALVVGHEVGHEIMEVEKKDWFLDFWAVAQGRDGKRPLYRRQAEVYFHTYVPADLQPACVEAYTRYLRQCRETDRQPCDPFRFIRSKKGELWREFLRPSASAVAPPRTAADAVQGEPPPPEVVAKLARLGVRLGS